MELKATNSETEGSRIFIDFRESGELSSSLKGNPELCESTKYDNEASCLSSEVAHASRGFGFWYVLYYGEDARTTNETFANANAPIGTASSPSAASAIRGRGEKACITKRSKCL